MHMSRKKSPYESFCKKKEALAPVKLTLGNTGVRVVKENEVGWERWPGVLHPVREHRAAR
jgi:hypothetical protein